MSIGLGFWFVCDFKVLFGTSRCVVISVGLVHLRRLKGRPDFFWAAPEDRYGRFERTMGLWRKIARFYDTNPLFAQNDHTGPRGRPKKNPGAPSNVLDVRVLHWLPHTLKYQTKPWRSYPMLISFSFCFVISIRTYTLLVYWGTRGEDSWRRGPWGDSCWWRQPCLIGFLLKRR